MYEPNAAFNPAGIRDAVSKVEARVMLLQIFARGSVQMQGSERTFVAGKDRFLLVDSPGLPADKPVSIMGTVDDSAKPFKLQIQQTQPATK